VQAQINNKHFSLAQVKLSRPQKTSERREAAPF